MFDEELDDIIDILNNNTDKPPLSRRLPIIKTLDPYSKPCLPPIKTLINEEEEEEKVPKS